MASSRVARSNGRDSAILLSPSPGRPRAASIQGEREELLVDGPIGDLDESLDTGLVLEPRAFRTRKSSGRGCQAGWCQCRDRPRRRDRLREALDRLIQGPGSGQQGAAHSGEGSRHETSHRFPGEVEDRPVDMLYQWGTAAADLGLGAIGVLVGGARSAAIVSRIDWPPHGRHGFSPASTCSRPPVASPRPEPSRSGSGDDSSGCARIQGRRIGGPAPRCIRLVTRARAGVRRVAGRRGRRPAAVLLRDAAPDRAGVRRLAIARPPPGSAGIGTHRRRTHRRRGRRAAAVLLRDRHARPRRVAGLPLPTAPGPPGSADRRRTHRRRPAGVGPAGVAPCRRRGRRCRRRAPAAMLRPTAPGSAGLPLPDRARAHRGHDRRPAAVLSRPWTLCDVGAPTLGRRVGGFIQGRPPQAPSHRLARSLDGDERQYLQALKTGRREERTTFQPLQRRPTRA